MEEKIINEIDELVKQENSPIAVFRNEFQSWWWINHSRYDMATDEKGYTYIKYTYAQLRQYYFTKIWKPSVGPKYAKRYKFPKNYNEQILKFVEEHGNTF